MDRESNKALIFKLTTDKVILSECLVLCFEYLVLIHRSQCFIQRFLDNVFSLEYKHLTIHNSLV